MADSNQGSTGLRGMVAGETSICTVGKMGTGLTYYGYDIMDLAEKARFEEVSYLLSRGKLPIQAELDDYRQRLQARRGLPQPLREALERIPADAHPMDVLRTGCSMLGNLETETDFDQQDDRIDRMLAALPAIICYWYRFSHDGERITTDQSNASSGSYFLQLLHGEAPSDLHAKALNTSLILYAEHGFNASTFTARVCASTLSDIHSCVTAAIGSLRGPLHGGANEAAMAMIEKFSSPDEAEQGLLQMLERKEKIMGFGHAVYRKFDPRNRVIKQWAKELADAAGDRTLFPVSERIEEVMWREKELFPNTDFYHAPALHFLGIPTKLFTPIFAMARVAGWTAHVKEQRANNRIIRPSAEYVGPDKLDWVPIDQRGH